MLPRRQKNGLLRSSVCQGGTVLEQKGRFSCRLDKKTAFQALLAVNAAKHFGGRRPTEGGRSKACGGIPSPVPHRGGREAAGVRGGWLLRAAAKPPLLNRKARLLAWRFSFSRPNTPNLEPLVPGGATGNSAVHRSNHPFSIRVTVLL